MSQNPLMSAGEEARMRRPSGFPPAPASPEPSLGEFFAQVRAAWRAVALVVAAGTLLATLTAFLWPPTYRATATLMPPTSEESGGTMSSMLRNLSFPGIRIPSRLEPEDIALGILESRRLAGILVDRFDLVRTYRVETKDAAIRKLFEDSDFKVNTNGNVVITVDQRDAKRAADIANAYIEELDRFNRDVRMTRGRRMRLFVEQRLTETRAALTRADQDLRDHSRTHRAVALSPEQMSTAEGGARLFAQKTALEVQLGVTRDYASESSEEVRAIRQQLDQINREISGLPAVGMELQRLYREVKIQEQVFALLSAQYEEARIDEARDVPTIEVLDAAVPPDRRLWPRRGLLIGLGFALSCFTALAVVAWTARHEPRTA